MDGVKQKIKYDSSNKYTLTLPKAVIASMGWHDDPIFIIPDPINNKLTIKNKVRKPVGDLGFNLNFNNLKWIKNKKQYAKQLNQNLTPEGRKVLYETNWDEVEDGSYRTIEQLKVQKEHTEAHVKELQAQHKEMPKELKESHKDLLFHWKGIIKSYDKYIKNYQTYLKKKGLTSK
jgi:hypothetical protein